MDFWEPDEAEMRDAGRQVMDLDEVGLWIGPEPSPGFCPKCNYTWAVHRPTDTPDAIRPFGCPPDETTARARWGR